MLAHSKRYYQNRAHGQKILTDWARHLLLQVHRLLPERRLVAGAGFVVISLLAQMQHLPYPICLVMRFRLDAALNELAPARLPHQKGLSRRKGRRWPALTRIFKDSHFPNILGADG